MQQERRIVDVDPGDARDRSDRGQQQSAGRGQCQHRVVREGEGEAHSQPAGHPAQMPWEHAEQHRHQAPGPLELLRHHRGEGERAVAVRLRVDGERAVPARRVQQEGGREVLGQLGSEPADVAEGTGPHGVAAPFPADSRAGAHGRHRAGPPRRSRGIPSGRRSARGCPPCTGCGGARRRGGRRRHLAGRTRARRGPRTTPGSPGRGPRRTATRRTGTGSPGAASRPGWRAPPPAARRGPGSPRTPCAAGARRRQGRRCAGAAPRRRSTSAAATGTAAARC